MDEERLSQLEVEMKELKYILTWIFSFNIGILIVLIIKIFF
jgi:hypothetical protein